MSKPLLFLVLIGLLMGESMGWHFETEVRDGEDRVLYRDCYDGPAEKFDGMEHLVQAGLFVDDSTSSLNNEEENIDDEMDQPHDEKAGDKITRVDLYGGNMPYGYFSFVKWKISGYSRGHVVQHIQNRYEAKRNNVVTRSVSNNYFERWKVVNPFFGRRRADPSATLELANGQTYKVNDIFLWGPYHLNGTTNFKCDAPDVCTGTLKMMGIVYHSPEGLSAADAGAWTKNGNGPWGILEHIDIKNGAAGPNITALTPHTAADRRIHITWTSASNNGTPTDQPWGCSLDTLKNRFDKTSPAFCPLPSAKSNLDSAKHWTFRVGTARTLIGESKYQIRKVKEKGDDSFSNIVLNKWGFKSIPRNVFKLADDCSTDNTTELLLVESDYEDPSKNIVYISCFLKQTTLTGNVPYWTVHVLSPSSTEITRYEWDPWPARKTVKVDDGNGESFEDDFYVRAHMVPDSDFISSRSQMDATFNAINRFPLPRNLTKNLRDLYSKLYYFAFNTSQRLFVMTNAYGGEDVAIEKQGANLRDGKEIHVPQKLKKIAWDLSGNIRFLETLDLTVKEEGETLVNATLLEDPYFISGINASNDVVPDLGYTGNIPPVLEDLDMDDEDRETVDDVWTERNTTCDPFSFKCRLFPVLDCDGFGYNSTTNVYLQYSGPDWTLKLQDVENGACNDKCKFEIVSANWSSLITDQKKMMNIALTCFKKPERVNCYTIGQVIPDTVVGLDDRVKAQFRTRQTIMVAKTFCGVKRVEPKRLNTMVQQDKGVLITN